MAHLFMSKYLLCQIQSPFCPGVFLLSHPMSYLYQFFKFAITPIEVYPQFFCSPAFATLGIRKMETNNSRWCSGVQGCILVPGLDLGCVSTKKTSTSFNPKFGVKLAISWENVHF
jgi:hypothetical protein